jgi:hypothetical protein
MRAVIEALDFLPTHFLAGQDTVVGDAIVVQVGTRGEAFGYEENEESERSQEDEPCDGAIGFLRCKIQRRAKNDAQGDNDCSHTDVRFVGVEYGSEHRKPSSQRLNCGAILLVS